MKVHSTLRKPVVLLGLTIILLAILYALVGCDLAPKPTATAVPPTKPPATATPAPPQATPTPAVKPPLGTLEMVAVPGRADVTHAITATLPGTTVTVAMYTSGLTNVSVGVPVALKAGAEDPKGAPAKKFSWTLWAPSNSKAALSAKDTEVVKFTPDVVGTYKVDVTVSNDAGSAPAKAVVVNAGTYIGVEKGKCATCHKDKVEEWAKTGHARMFTSSISGGADPKTSHYSERCVRCHTTGYYIGVENGGFADVQKKTGWKFPALTDIQTKGKAMWDAVPADLKALANIQCEVCHGPAKEHATTGVKVMAASLDNGVCNQCHDGGGHHVKGTEWRYSKHGEEASTAWAYASGPGRTPCVRCHSGEGYASFIENPKEPATWKFAKEMVTCATCHDPHSDKNPWQLRIAGKPVEVTFDAPNAGLSATCMECHNDRQVTADAAKGSYPHYSSAAELVYSNDGIDYGQTLVNSPHGMVVGVAPIQNKAVTTTVQYLFSSPEDKKGNVPGPCVTCHMWPTLADAKDPNRFKVGEHTFGLVSPDGKFQYTEPCQACHAGIKTFNILAKADYDGNGKVEGVQDEVAGLLKVLKKA
ncbi:MAG: hypothetical protein HY783_10125, partial [Chloroflexi bacterium]|nr:hypothetical protein [Chloroflexota bacterium]